MPTGLKYFKKIFTDHESLYAEALMYLRTSVKEITPETRF
jgi:hypothetical protein